ncbi:Hypothetical predicted protein [Olea europaea subsp. europaea]|uniref:Uncharacterized protein n=1 Tax=Olea europaea subsp. europaea TaxID=158383 RepID=A0A8S0RGK9_OLEEU|nr:Hypothetical predicted protein [Olea europaea subsp. europaea]
MCHFKGGKRRRHRDRRWYEVEPSRGGDTLQCCLASYTISCAVGGFIFPARQPLLHLKALAQNGSPQRCRFAASAGGAGEEEAQTQASRSVAQFFLHGI